LRDILVNKDNFEVEGGHLALHGVDLVNLCEEHGTPLFVFDEDGLVDNFLRLRRAFEDVHSKTMVCYSIKTNNNLAICKILRLNHIAGEMGVKQSIGLRINPFKDPGFSKYTNLKNLINASYCNLESRFGFSIEEAFSAFKHAKELRNLSIEGIMTHPYHSAKMLLPIIQEVHARYEIEIKYLNIGGGFYTGEPRFVGSNDIILDFFRRKMGMKSKIAEGEMVSSIESIADLLINEIRQDLGDLPDYTIIV